MNKLVKVLSVSLLLLTPIAVCAQNFVEGTHYSRLEHRLGSSASMDDGVVEYFSFSCPGCYAIEPAINALMKSKPSINLRKVHMPYGGYKAKYSQKAFVVMTLLNANEHRSTIFHRIHIKQSPFDSDGELVDFFQSLGYERSIVESTLNSFAADMLVRKMNQEAMQKQIASVPTITINDRYKVNVRAVNTTDDLNALIQYLSALP